MLIYALFYTKLLFEVREYSELLLLTYNWINMYHNLLIQIFRTDDW